MDGVGFSNVTYVRIRSMPPLFDVLQVGWSVSTLLFALDFRVTVNLSSSSLPKRHAANNVRRSARKYVRLISHGGDHLK